MLQHSHRSALFLIDLGMSRCHHTCSQSVTLHHDSHHSYYWFRFRTICFAKHANDKGAKWAKSKRPKKSSPADINRKPVVYELTSMVKPAEFTVSSEPATSVAKSG
jgi:hypothetical protein